MKLMKFEIKKNKGQWYFRIVARNGKILAHSEKYKRKCDAARAVGIIQRQAAEAEIHG